MVPVGSEMTREKQLLTGCKKDSSNEPTKGEMEQTNCASGSLMHPLDQETKLDHSTVSEALDWTPYCCIIVPSQKPAPVLL